VLRFLSYLSDEFSGGDWFGEALGERTNSHCMTRSAFTNVRSSDRF
jgi:hypothetical protein